MRRRTGSCPPLRSTALPSAVSRNQAFNALILYIISVLYILCIYKVYIRMEMVFILSICVCIYPRFAVLNIFGIFFFLLQHDSFSQLGNHLCFSEKRRSYFWRLFSPSLRAVGRARLGPCGAVCSDSVAPERPGEGVQGEGHCPPPWSLGFCLLNKCLCSPGMCPAAGHGPGWAAVESGDRWGWDGEG